MSAKEMAILAVFVIFILPSLIGTIIWTFKVTNTPSIDNVKEGTERIAEVAIPWWIDVFDKLSDIKGPIGGILVIGLLLFLIWIGEIKTKGNLQVI